MKKQLLGKITPKRVKVLVREDGTREIIDDVPTQGSEETLTLPPRPGAPREDAAIFHPSGEPRGKKTQ